MTERGQAKILDFGLAKLTPGSAGVPPATRGNATAGKTPALPGDKPTRSVDPEHLTSPGVAMGTVAYMSPEQARGEQVDARTDLFSFGAVLYEMSTGRPAFGAGTTAAIFGAILYEAPASPCQLNPELPLKLEEIILKALEKERDTRYQVAAEMRADLKRLRRETTSGRAAAATIASQTSRAASGRTAKDPRVPLWKRRLGLVAFAVTAVAAAIVVYAATRPLPPPKVLSYT